MGLDQQACIIANQEKLKEFYTFRYGDPNNTTVFDNADEPQELYLHNQYTVQGFIKKLAASKGLEEDDGLNGAYVRLREEDVKRLYKISKDIKLVKEYAEKWRKGMGTYCDDFDQQQIQDFCHAVMGYAAFDDEYAVYFEGDW